VVRRVGDERAALLVADERGSVAAVTDESGAPIQLNTYDEYGLLGANNSGRFQFTSAPPIAAETPARWRI